MSKRIFPKKTLISRKPLASTWSRRNNSTGVADLLKSSLDANYSSNDSNSDEDDDNEPRKSPHLRGKAASKEFKSPCPKCYCNSFPIEPVLHLKTCDARERCNNEFRDNDFESNFSEAKKNYEDLTRNYFLDIKLHHQERPSSNASNERSLANDEGHCLDFAADASLSGEMKRLRRFRDRNYFECHSTNDLLRPEFSINNERDKFNSYKKHTCLHKLTLNKRLRLEAEEPDSCGLSRCTLCARTLSAAIVSMPANENKASSKTSISTKQFPGGDESEMNSGEREKYTVITKGNELLDISLPNDVNWPSFVGSDKRKGMNRPRNKLLRSKLQFEARPLNSLALSHQKGLNL